MYLKTFNATNLFTSIWIKHIVIILNSIEYERDNGDTILAEGHYLDSSYVMFSDICFQDD